MRRANPYQLSLFGPETPLLATITRPATTYRTKRTYCRHRQQHVLFLHENYHCYTLKELAQILELTEQQVFKLCRRHGIRKRAPNHPKEKAHNPFLAVAA
jgi:hypothetical protein